jgi:hypothetical protein
MATARCSRCESQMELDGTCLYEDIVQGVIYFVCPFCSHSEPLSTSNLDILGDHWMDERE